MEFFLNEIKEALDARLYYLALQAALTLPDICGALESSNGKAGKDKYISWFERYAKESGPIVLSGEDCYYFRCSCVHQFSTQHPKSTYKKLIFLIPGRSLVAHNNIVNGALNIDVIKFCNNMISAVKKWHLDVKDDPVFQRNEQKLVKVHPNGIPGFIANHPVIG